MSASRPPYWDFQSAARDWIWPALPGPDGAAVLALLFQLEQTQRLPAERLLQLQLRQLDQVLRHAHATVPYYRERWRGVYDPALEITPERFAALPLLTRRELQDQYAAMHSERVPAALGSAGETRTSGATGSPVRVAKTALDTLFWNAFTLREHLWHRRDLRCKLAVIRQGVEAGEFDSWGSATAGLVSTGPVVTLGVAADVDTQLQWLVRHEPEYLLTYASNLAELAKTALARGVRLPGLREVRTIGETLSAEQRELCRQAWGVPVIDFYSAQEVGYIALQCPLHEHYHVQSEGVLVEVLDDRDRPCAPGEVGRVVVTALHNFATPLIRYEIGDYAEVGQRCQCGRGLPVLRRIVGRVRNTLVTADGARYWPTFGVRGFAGIAPVLQHQFVQKEYDLVEARLVTSARLTTEQEEQLRQRILSRLPPGFRLRFSYHERIARGAGGKYEDFISEVTAASR